MSHRSLQLITLCIGTLLMAIKFAAWWLTNSNAILSDASESIINIAAGVFAFYSLGLAAKPRDSNHPYGHGKIEFLSAGFEGGLIFLAGIGIVIKAGYNLLYPQNIQHLDLGLYLTVFSGVINYVMGHLLERRGRLASSLTLIASGKHLKSDAWSSLGLVVGLLIVAFTNIPVLDSVVAAIFGLVILYTGFSLMRKSVAGIMDEADYQLIAQLVQVLDQHRRPTWIDVHNFRVIKYGATLHIDCHITVPWYFSTRDSHAEVKAFENLVVEKNELPVELFVHVDPCEPDASCRICKKTDCAVRGAPFSDHIAWTLDNIMADKPHSS